jgi:flagellar hook-associated protein 2
VGISLNPATLLSGQGLDISSLVSQILSQSSGQLTEWQGEQSTLQSQASDLTAINSALSNLATSVTALADPLGALTAQSATSSDTSVLSATADTTAAAGTHTVAVSNLATAGAVYTNEFTGGANISILPTNATSGEIDLQIGGANAVPITITPGSNDTLTTLASYINGQNLGVNASVVTDANGSRLALVSQKTGSAGALAISGNNTSLSFNTPTAGLNAQLTIDGVPYASASNTVTGAIPGVTLNLANQSSGSPVQLTVGPDAVQATNAINNFVSAYNQVITDINQETAFNTSTNSQGPLGSDSSVAQLQSSLLNDTAFSVTGNGGDVNLASLGINTNNNGTLTVDSSQLNSALASNPAAVQNFFQNTASTGFANAFNIDLTNLTDPTQGILNVDLAQNTTQQTDLTTSINNFQTQLTAQQKSLTAQYAAVNAALQAYPLLLQEMTETLATLGTGSSGATNSSSSPVLTSGL